MAVFAVVVVRLMGVWLIVSSVPTLFNTLMGLVRSESGAERDSWMMPMLVVVAYAVVGLFLLILSRPLARLVMLRLPVDAPSSPAMTERAFLQAGIFLIGLTTFVPVVPLLVGLARGDGFGGGYDLFWIQGGVGFLLMAFSGLFSGLVARLREGR